MEYERFFDFVGGLALTGSVVRMDMVSLSTIEKDEKDQPKAAVRQRLIMPVEGFARSFAVMASMMQQLEKRGVLKRNAEPYAQGASLAGLLPAKK